MLEVNCRNSQTKGIFEDLGVKYFPRLPPSSLTDPFCRVIDQLWTSVGHFITHLLTTNIEPLIQKSLEGFSLKDFKFDRVLLGSIPPRIGSKHLFGDIICSLFLHIQEE